MKSLIVQRRALRDLNDAQLYYRQTAPHMEPRFAAMVDAEFAHLQEHPGTGSPRYGLRLGIPDLRSWPLKKFPYLIFYTERDTQIEVLRVLHQAADIPTHLDE